MDEEAERSREQRPRRVFSNPSAFKYSYQFHPFSSWSFELARPLELASVDQRTDTNRGCIQRALARAFSLSLSLSPLSSTTSFLLPSRLQRGRTHSFSHPGTGFPLSLCWPLDLPCSSPVTTAAATAAAAAVATAATAAVAAAARYSYRGRCALLVKRGKALS